MIIYVSAKQGSHGPRIKVSQDHSEKFNMRNTASVSIADDPKVVVGELSAKDFEAVKRYVLLNKDVLLKFWSGEIDTIELAAELKKV